MESTPAVTPPQIGIQKGADSSAPPPSETQTPRRPLKPRLRRDLIASHTGQMVRVRSVIHTDVPRQLEARRDHATTFNADSGDSLYYSLKKSRRYRICGGRRERQKVIPLALATVRTVQTHRGVWHGSEVDSHLQLVIIGECLSQPNTQAGVLTCRPLLGSVGEPRKSRI